MKQKELLERGIGGDKTTLSCCPLHTHYTYTLPDLVLDRKINCKGDNTNQDERGEKKRMSQVCCAYLNRGGACLVLQTDFFSKDNALG